MIHEIENHKNTHKFPNKIPKRLLSSTDFRMVLIDICSEFSSTSLNLSHVSSESTVLLDFAIFSRMCLASFSRPCEISHLGDSGISLRKKKHR